MCGGDTHGGSILDLVHARAGKDSHAALLKPGRQRHEIFARMKLRLLGELSTRIADLPDE